MFIPSANSKGDATTHVRVKSKSRVTEATRDWMISLEQAVYFPATFFDFAVFFAGVVLPFFAATFSGVGAGVATSAGVALGTAATSAGVLSGEAAATSVVAVAAASGVLS